jgi:hypothetical protein
MPTQKAASDSFDEVQVTDGSVQLPVAVVKVVLVSA